MPMASMAGARAQNRSSALAVGSGGGWIGLKRNKISIAALVS